MAVSKAEVNKAWHKYDKYIRDSEKTGRFSELYANRLMLDAQLKQKEYQDYSPRKKNPTITTSSIPVGEWTPAHAIRRNADGTVDVLREKNSGRRANISEGFLDPKGIFHPIRHASDYSPRAAKEKRAYAKKRRPTSKLKGRAYAGGVSYGSMATPKNVKKRVVKKRVVKKKATRKR